MKEDGTWGGGGGRECHALCFGPGSADVRLGKLRSFQFPSHTASTLHHTLLPCMRMVAAPCSPHFFCFAPPLRSLTPAAAAPAWCLQGQLLGGYALATANTLLCAVDYLMPGAKQVRPSHTLLMVPALLALGQGTTPLLSSWNGGSRPGLGAKTPVLGVEPRTAIVPARTGRPC